MPAPGFVLLREDRPFSTLSSDKPPSHPTFLSVFSSASSSAVFTAEHAYSPETERSETKLYMGGELVGTASLASLGLGDGAAVPTSRFFEHPHCFSAKQLFRLPSRGGWVYWRQPKKEGEAIKLLEYKTKAPLAKVEALKREDGLILPTATRITLAPSIIASSPSLHTHLPLDSPTFSLAALPISPSSSSSRLATRTGSSSSSFSSASQMKGKGKEGAELEPIAVVLLTLLHLDYVTVDKVRKREQADLEEGEHVWDAW
ncbi:hypothetical protein JCM10213_004713 [Rhodosporidiobolus nylandii]